jgi:hypothetical protein
VHLFWVTRSGAAHLSGCLCVEAEQKWQTTVYCTPTRPTPPSLTASHQEEERESVWSDLRTGLGERRDEGGVRMK